MWTAGSASEEALSLCRAQLAVSLNAAGVIGNTGRVQGGNMQDREFFVSAVCFPAWMKLCKYSSIKHRFLMLHLLHPAQVQAQYNWATV